MEAGLTSNSLCDLLGIDINEKAYDLVKHIYSLEFLRYNDYKNILLQARRGNKNTT